MKKLLYNYLFWILFAIQIIVTIFYASNLANEKYSYIGDEFNFYVHAKQIANGEITPNPLSLDGVFREHPLLGSYYQAMVMKVFGDDIYGWKLASILIIFPLGLFMFYIVRRLGDMPTAFFALIATDISFYFYNFFQIGYLNNLSLLLLVIIIYILTFLPVKQSVHATKIYILLGITVGFSWYFYIGKLFILIVSIYLLCDTWNKKLLQHFIFFLIPALLLIAVGVLSTPSESYLGLNKTILHREFSDNLIVLRNIVYPFILQFYSPTQTHYLPEPRYTDVLTAGLATVGIILLVLSLLVKRFRLFPKWTSYLLLFSLTCLFVGITIPYTNPPITRGIHYVLFYILFASFCLLFLTSFIPRHKIVIYGVVIIVVVFLNVMSIAKPLPMHINQKLLSYIKSQPNSKVVLVKSSYCVNVTNLTTAGRSYNLPHEISLLESFDKKYCKPSNIIISCIPDICNEKPVKTFENRVFIYKN